MFDVKEFASNSNAAPLDDTFNLHPEGEFKGQIPLDPEKAFTSKTGTSEKGNAWAQLTIRLETLDPLGNIEKELGRKPGITDRFFIDLDEQGSFDYAKQRNVRTGQYLSATGCNKPGWKFTDMCGKQLKFKVIHVKSDMDPTRKVAQVTTLGVA